MTIQDLKEFDLKSCLTEDDWNRWKNFTYDEFKDEMRIWFWFYWSGVLIRENLLELVESGEINEELRDKIFSKHSEVFAEKFKDILPEEK